MSSYSQIIEMVLKNLRDKFGSYQLKASGEAC